MEAALGNFASLTSPSPRLARLAVLAERCPFDDAPAALIKLRQLGEVMAKEIASRHAVLPATSIIVDEILRTVKVRRILQNQVADLFSYLRRGAPPRDRAAQNGGWRERDAARAAVLIQDLSV